MSSQPKAVVLVSGGMDSCVTAAMARQTHELALLHASYAQRTERRERQAFDEIADFYSVTQRLVVYLDHFAQISSSALTDKRIAVPEGVRAPLSGGLQVEPTPVGARQDAEARKLVGGNEIPSTYVPFRNAHFLAVAVSWAEVIGASAVFIGAVAEDSSGYPDCRPEYYRVFQQLVREGTRPETRIEIVTPIIAMRKREIVLQGIALDAPLDRTWSCYQFDDEACGSCDSCLLRLNAFAEAGVADPIAYRARVER